MSDAKAKFEARRAKIMARSTNSVAVVTSDDAVDETLYNNLVNTEVKVKERPLASRRRMVLKTSSSDNLSAATTPVKEEPTSTTESTEEKEKKEDSAETSEKSEDKAEAASPSPSEGDKSASSSAADKATAAAAATPAPASASQETPKKSKIQYEPAKTLEQIEQEIAERTAQFDQSVRSDTKTSLSSKRKQQAAASKAVAMKVKPMAIDPSNVMRLIRLIMIVFLGAYSGFRAVENSRLEALKVLTPQTTTTTLSDASAEFVFDAPSAPTIEATATETKTRTWPEYFQQRITRQTECSLTAVGLVWWMSRFFSTAVHSQFKQQPKQMKPLEMVMDFLTNGINSFVESIFAGIGEISLHLFVLVISATVFTMYFSNAAVDAGLMASAQSVESEL